MALYKFCIIIIFLLLYSFFDFASVDVVMTPAILDVLKIPIYQLIY